MNVIGKWRVDKVSKVVFVVSFEFSGWGNVFDIILFFRRERRIFKINFNNRVLTFLWVLI